MGWESCRVWGQGLIPRAVGREEFGMFWKLRERTTFQGKESGQERQLGWMRYGGRWQLGERVGCDSYCRWASPSVAPRGPKGCDWLEGASALSF